MGFEYLEELGLDEVDQKKLRSLGARTALALLSLLEHAPEKFADPNFIGPEKTKALSSALEKLVSEKDRAKLASLPEFRGKFGARLVSQSSTESLAATRRRDELMRKLEDLRSSGDDSPENLEAQAELERLLRDELPKTISNTAFRSQ